MDEFDQEDSAQLDWAQLLREMLAISQVGYELSEQDTKMYLEMDQRATHAAPATLQ